MFRIGGFEFKPGLWPTLVTLLVLPCLLALGLWQMDRATQKQALMEKYSDRGADQPLLLERDTGSSEYLHYRPALAKGYYDSTHQFLLDNRTRHGRAGYQVLTPFRIATSGQLVLVNRGWIPQGMTRDELPDIRIDDGIREIEGILYLPPEKTFSLGEGKENAPGWPKLLQHVQFDLQQRQLGHALIPAVLLLAPDMSDGFVREWQPAFLSPEKHRGYAFQWFSLAGALILIYLIVNFRRNK